MSQSYLKFTVLIIYKQKKMPNRLQKHNQSPYEHIKVLSREQLNKLLDDQKFNSTHLSKIPLHLLEDKEILIKLANQPLYFPDLLELLSPRFKSDENNKEIFLRIFCKEHSGHGMREMPKKCRSDLDFALDILQRRKDKMLGVGWIYEDLHSTLKRRKQVALLAIDAGAKPRDLPEKFKEDIDFLKAYVKAREMFKKKYTHSNGFDSLNELKHFKLYKMDLSNAFVAKLIQKDPSTYGYFSPKHKRLKKLAWMAIKADIGSYKDLPDKLKRDMQIINYVVARQPKILVDNIDNKSLMELNFFHLDLSKKARDYIYRAAEKVLIANKADVLEIAKYKAGIYSYSKDNTNAKPFNNWHFSKAEVLKVLASKYKDHWNSHEQHQLFINISYELKFDLDVISQFIISTGSEVVQFCEKHHLPVLITDISKVLFSKGKYRGISLPEKGKVRDYMVKRLCDAAINRRNNADFYFSSKFDLQGLLSAKEQKKYINKYPLLLLDFWHDKFIENSKHLSKQQKLRLIDQDKTNNLLDSLHYAEVDFFGEMFKHNITLAKKIILHWPNKEQCRYVDFKYFCNNPSFNAFLANLEQITIHDSDFSSLPPVLKNNKLFIKKALTYNMGLFKKIGKSLQTDPEITDWIFAIRPHLAKCLSRMQFNKLDTTNLHPIARKIIYKQYNAKFKKEDVLENALIKQRLLQLNQSNQQAA